LRADFRDVTICRDDQVTTACFQQDKPSTTEGCRSSLFGDALKR
jgi:hypothetical protein